MKTYKLMLWGAMLACPASVLAEPFGTLGLGWTAATNIKETSAFDVPHQDEAKMAIHGKVQEMNRELSFSREWPDTSMKVQTKSGIVTVILGPDWYLSEHFPKILPGDVITVEGSRVLYRNIDTILAGEVGKGNEVLRLRDSAGRPLWAQ